MSIDRLLSGSIIGFMEKYEAGQSFIAMSRAEVRAVDRWAIEEVGVPGVVLMENAGRSCAELIREKLAGVEEARVCIFCGTGNNGGDGYVIARHLINAGFSVVVVICGDRSRVKGDAKLNLDILERLGQPIEELELKLGAVQPEVGRLAADAEMVVDALFGTGLSGRLGDEYVELIEGINALGKAVLAIDIPSGLDCDTGRVLGAAIRASYTVTFVAVKKGFAVRQGVAQYTGEVFVASIGVERGRMSD
jgi:NAD(P)H-hydrate epimerase